MSCKIYFIRHGQSAGNLSGTYLGHTDLDLTPLGYSQAEQTARYLADKKIDSVYSSDLQRAYHTCEAFLKLSGLTAETDRRLREIYSGDWENKTFSFLKESYPGTYGIWLNDIGSSHPDNGESVEELLERVCSAINSIAAENDGKTVAVFTHATVIRSFFNYAYGRSLKELKKLPWASNASVSSVEYSSGVYTVCEYGTDGFLGNIASQLPANV